MYVLLLDCNAICYRIAEVEDSADWKDPMLSLHAASDDLRGGRPLICEKLNRVGTWVRRDGGNRCDLVLFAK